MIKRFTGGGTVVVDADTIFTTLIMQVWAHNGTVLLLVGGPTAYSDCQIV